VATSTVSSSNWTTCSHCVNVLYATPLFPLRSDHRYDASGFERVDFTTNHTGDTHACFQKVEADPGCDERGLYFWQDGGYVCWLGVKALPKLNYDSHVLRQRVFEDREASSASGSPAPTGSMGGGSTSPT